jgi:hypothetical protein
VRLGAPLDEAQGMQLDFDRFHVFLVNSNDQRWIV